MKNGVALGAAVAIAAVVGLLAQQRPDPLPPSAASTTRPSGMTSPDAFDDPGEPSQAAEVDTLSGRVVEVIDVVQYTYLRLASAQGELWAAVSKSPVAVGSSVSIQDATRMEHFESASLKRTFDVIYFGNLQGNTTANLPPGHPSIEDPARDSHGGIRPLSASEAVNTADIKVERAAGSNARSVAELFAESSKLQGHVWRVRGQVVKATPGVMGKTYFRIRDGSSAGSEQRDLVMTSTSEVSVGVVATFEGTLRRNVDVGIGIVYPILLEDVKVLLDSPVRAP